MTQAPTFTTDMSEEGNIPEQRAVVAYAHLPMEIASEPGDFETELARLEMWGAYTGVVPIGLDDKSLKKTIDASGEVVIVLPVKGAISNRVVDLDEDGVVKKRWTEYRIRLTDDRIVVIGGKAATQFFSLLFSRIPEGDFPTSVTLEVRYRVVKDGHKLPVYKLVR